MDYELIQGDCLDVLPGLAAGSADAVICDPPYPEIDRDYGRLTEDQWWVLMMGVCAEVRRVLKPTGSAVFILQPNSRKVGSMRGWLWRFMWWVTTDWNMVQDVWWWNTNAMPSGGCSPRERGLVRASVKACVWAGQENCHRSQDAVLIPVAERTQSHNDDTARRVGYNTRTNGASGQGGTIASFDKALQERGGVIPFNCLPVGVNSVNGGNGHGAGTPLKLADWWTRYIVPPGGTVLDPFNGAGTMGVAALQNGAHYIGIEQMQKYIDVSHERLAKVQPALPFAAALPDAAPQPEPAQAAMFGD